MGPVFYVNTLLMNALKTDAYLVKGGITATRSALNAMKTVLVAIKIIALNAKLALL